ncbi:MAG: sulfite reductase [Candidatus Nitrohelix vancouverensis]|uniref:Sulfite reductase n=1 Tax=Candidatus Nitrohelix vancouverensis TaxID=2705534 RepID=A0A7T0C3C6_9BACT|nr:MAG: sulfite reductase [Candidatus Nitrohelix vancouverensis]
MDAKTINIPEVVRREIEDFAAEVERLERGEVSDDDFKRFRLQQGIYGQRQENQQMVRTKLPQGRLSSEQLNVLADFADKYSNKILHVTTRQDIQFHYVNVKDVPEAMQLLAENGMTTREACGNTVRNVTACHKAGTCKDELFDVSPYGRAVTDFLIRHQMTQNLPRKFKISLGGCNGCGLSPMHDIGLNAADKVIDGKRVLGFKVVVGGGLGSSPRIAQPFSDFVEAHNLLRLCESVVAVFDKHGDKRNRNKARFKYVLDKLGSDKVNQLIQEEFDARADKKFPKIEVPEEFTPHIPKFEANTEFDADPEFQSWKARNTFAQKQDGFFNVHIKLLLGDLNSDQARALSRITSQYAAGRVVNTVNQNIMIPWIQESAFGHVFGELKKIGLHKAGTEEIRDITCCPGSETCNLGITASRGIAEHLSKEMENGFPHSADLDHISIKASGCPNSCGQHHIASIGLHGGAKKVNGILTPHYELFLGGYVTEEAMKFGESVIKLPAKNSPAAIRKLIEDYKEKKQSEERFEGYVERMGKPYFKELLRDYIALEEIEKNPFAYLDYGSEKKFSLEDRGQGECAGAVTDMITDRLSEAERAQFQCKLALENKQYQESVDFGKRSAVASARALLVTEGMDFTDDLECMEKFHSLIIDMEIVSQRFSSLIEQFRNTSTVTQEQSEWWVANAQDLLEQCKLVTNKLHEDKSLRIRTGGDSPAEEQKSSKKEATVEKVSMDLLGVKCPFNYVKAKLKLEMMNSGQLLEILLDDGEPIQNVPKSLGNDGHEILSQVSENGHHKIVVKKA